MLKEIRNIFITGLIIILPVVVSIYVIYELFVFIDGLFKGPLDAILGIYVPGIGIVVTFVFLFLMGIIAKNYFGKKLIIWAEQIFLRIPLVKTVYLAVKQITDTLYAKKKQAFKKAVMIEYPKDGIYTIGFITSYAPVEIVNKIGVKCVSVFVPTTPNPTSGMYVILPEKDVYHLNMNIEEAIKLVVSGGIVTPEDITKEWGNTDEN